MTGNYIQYYHYDGDKCVLVGWLHVSRIVKIIPVSVSLKVEEGTNGHKKEKVEVIWHPGCLIDGGEALILMKANFGSRVKCLEFMDKHLELIRT